MDWTQTKDMILMGIPALGVAVISYYLNRMDNTGARLQESVQELNVKMAVVLEKLSGHEERIKKLEDDEA